MSNQVSTTHQLYTHVKTADSVCTISILSAVRRVLELKAEIERDILGLNYDNKDEMKDNIGDN